jgi:hypothetical protein
MNFSELNCIHSRFILYSQGVVFRELVALPGVYITASRYVHAFLSLTVPKRSCPASLGGEKARSKIRLKHRLSSVVVPV